jgi:ParB-like chromosome segregation protein Spo0J
MKNSSEVVKSEYFQFPDIEKEDGEFGRVAETFGLEPSLLMREARKGEMIRLTEELLSQLENADANTFQAGDWKAVHNYSNPDGVYKRDWETLKNKIEEGVVLDAPIVMKFCDRYHLVAGNTRLMIARAKGIEPNVLVFEVEIP